MSKTPTAEEVLGLYLKWNKTEEEFDEFRMQCRDEGEVHDFAMDVINDKEKFEATLCEWQSAQGPVTREWFVERFGGLICEWELFGICWLSGDVFLGVKRRVEYVYNRVPNPTRSKIEALVEMLGGTDAS